jgi:hypothetical protein
MYAIKTVAAECTPSVFEKISITKPSRNANNNAAHRGELIGKSNTNNI